MSEPQPLPELHTWQNCWPQIGDDRNSEENRKIRRVLRKNLTESDRVKMHQASCHGKLTPITMAVINKVRKLFADEGIGGVREYTKAVIACCNTDIAKNYPSGTFGPGFQSPVSVEHVLGVCDHCGAAVWVGPKQNELYEAGQATRVCYRCVHADDELREAFSDSIALDPDADAKPRRL